MENRYRVVLCCNKPNDKLIENIKSGLLQRLSLPDSVLERLISGQPIVVQHAASKEQARQHKDAIEAAGGICTIEPISLNRNIDDEGFIERREVERRSDEEHTGQLKNSDRRQKERRLSTKD